MARIIIDPSDVQRPYAKKMQYLAKVWDGSKGRVGDNLGYWGCMAVACEPGKRRGGVPLQFRLWSTEDPEYKGENAEIEAIIESIRAEVGNRGIYVYDRGISHERSSPRSGALAWVRPQRDLPLLHLVRDRLRRAPDAEALSHAQGRPRTLPRPRGEVPHAPRVRRRVQRQRRGRGHDDPLRRDAGAPEFFYYALADGIQKLFTRYGKWNAKLDLKKALVKPSPHPAIAAPVGLA